MPRTTDGRPDTSTASVIIKTKVSESDTLKSAIARVMKFIATTPMSGRTEIIRTGEWDLTIVGPEQYRDAIITLIAADAKHTADMFGPANGVAVEGLEHRVTWYQKGPLDLALYIPYTLKIAPLAPSPLRIFTSRSVSTLPIRIMRGQVPQFADTLCTMTG